MIEQKYISVIIPNLNHAERLDLTLNALKRQDFPMKVEIIVVDNGSNDESESVTQKYGVTFLNVKTPKNPYVCRNIGMKAARGDYFLLLDSTCVPGNTTFIKALFESALPTEVVVGKIQFELGDSPSVGEVADSILFIGNGEGGNERTDYPAGMLFFHRTLLEEVGYFREDMRSGADNEWTRRVASAGCEVKYLADAVVTYPSKRLRALLVKAHRTGCGHHTLLKETGSYRPLTELMRMRPPSLSYLNDIIDTRGRAEFMKRKFRLVLVIWLYRIFLGIGRVFG